MDQKLVKITLKQLLEFFSSHCASASLSYCWLITLLTYYMVMFYSREGTIQKRRHKGRGRGHPMFVTKEDIGGRGVHVNSDITTKKKLCRSSYFSLVFGQRGSRWALVSIPVVVSIQALAWVYMRRLNKAWSSLS